MGEIADMMIDGTLDAETGEYLGDGPGYPRTRNRSLPWERPFRWHRNNDLNGLYVYLLRQGHNHKWHDGIIKRYAEEHLTSRKLTTIAADIQKDFNSFRTWYLASKPTLKK